MEWFLLKGLRGGGYAFERERERERERVLLLPSHFLSWQSSGEQLPPPPPKPTPTSGARNIVSSSL